MLNSSCNTFEGELEKHFLVSGAAVNLQAIVLKTPVELDGKRIAQTSRFIIHMHNGRTIRMACNNNKQCNDPHVQESCMSAEYGTVHSFVRPMVVRLRLDWMASRVLETTRILPRLPSWYKSSTLLLSTVPSTVGPTSRETN